MSNHITHSTTETQQVAHDFISHLNPKSDSATVVGLSGDLGAGKTTFTQCVARELGITDMVVSPTFVIEKIYALENQIFTHLIHIDAYRLEHSDELLRLGWCDIISDPHNLILIEWPERVADIMPEHISIQFTHVSESVREIEMGGLVV